MKNMFIAMLICSISIGNLSAQDPTTKNSAETAKMLEQHFPTAAAEAAITEVEKGKLGQQKATSPRVKEFSKMMVSDHSKANDKLRNWSKRINASGPALPATRKTIDKMLKGRSGADFDRAVMKQMIEDHEGTIKRFEDEGRKVQNVGMRTRASY